MGYQEAKRERDLALLRMFGYIEDTELPAESEGKVDFDGGVREPAPPPADPEREHNDFVLELFENTKLGGGGVW
jgi:hypothetical protein